MDVRIDGSWCTIKEYCRISSWQQSENRLRQIIKKNRCPHPVKKLCYSSRRFLYMIQLTDPSQLAALKRLREICLVRKRVKGHARKVLGHTIIRNSTTAVKKRKTIRVNIRSYDYVFIQSNEFLGNLYDYIRNTGEDIFIKKDLNNIREDILFKKENFGSIFICVPQDVYDKLSKVAQKSSCSIGDALHIMILEFMKTQEGKEAANFVIKLSDASLAKERKDK
jgi:hypothetical protein